MLPSAPPPDTPYQPLTPGAVFGSAVLGEDGVIAWNTEGLVPVVVQDATSRAVLMVAWCNAESLRYTLTERYMHYYSRSRQALWKKGETSGHYQILKELWVDCDGDTLLAVVEQQGVACHTGAASCFFRPIALLEADR